MRVSCLGYSYIDYTSKKTGKPVLGIQYFFSYPERGVTGERTDSCFVPDSWSIVPPLTIPCSAEIEYNRFGHIQDISFA